ncbi:MAG: GCN5-related N-acetyltransferase [uncultured Solirubrobacteraceae bacterium]|uniref:GCN5-related N-acetyltransferase n=1 Tax=uncultured Solirubrobacteraceae bacterium TaxID=1162706 RepID=A0A6J4R3U4_9ACTN|nr:MAG: GCN5-related N-acetyltransferase [uncultured Solirubrobacteraceae bacterium]
MASDDLQAPADPSGTDPGHETDPLTLEGPTLTLRYATQDDAGRLFELAGDPQVTRWFSWGPYRDPQQPRSYIESLAGKRDRGELLDFLVVHRQDGPIGVTGLSELARRDGRATVGTWFAAPWWGSGANRESKAMLAALAFWRLGVNRLTAWANVDNTRSQAALEGVGFQREGVLRAWHRHGDAIHDVYVFGLLRDEWSSSPLADVPVKIGGTPPPAWLLD